MPSIEELDRLMLPTNTANIPHKSKRKKSKLQGKYIAVVPQQF